MPKVKRLSENKDLRIITNSNYLTPIISTIGINLIIGM